MVELAERVATLLAHARRDICEALICLVDKEQRRDFGAAQCRRAASERLVRALSMMEAVECDAERAVQRHKREARS